MFIPYRTAGCPGGRGGGHGLTLFSRIFTSRGINIYSTRNFENWVMKRISKVLDFSFILIRSWSAFSKI
jgi:hypothetical protein